MFIDPNKKPIQLFGYGSGDYICKCWTCGEAFTGAKRSTMCLPCAADRARSTNAGAGKLLNALENMLIGYGMGWDLDGIAAEARSVIAEVRGQNSSTDRDGASKRHMLSVQAEPISTPPPPTDGEKP